MIDKNRIEFVKPLAGDVSPTFCLAKWYHANIYLQTGETHSCYHPPPHKIDLDRISTTASALHNTDAKKMERREMLMGSKPSGCQYCWNIENLGSDHVSDRHIRNGAIYSPERLSDVKKFGWGFNVNPEYVEISFGNECQMSCVYCHPKASSAWYKEIEKHGPYTDSQIHRQDIDWLDIRKEEDNPYVAAWWRWWPDLAPNLNILRITGGEPLIHNSTWRLFDHLDSNPQPKLDINLNSNLSVKTILVDRLIERTSRLHSEGKIKWFDLYTSIDTWGPQAVYIRNGMDLATWEHNIDSFLTKTVFPVSLMITYNALSVSSFISLLEKILEFRKRYNYKDPTKTQRVKFDIPHLKEPYIFDMLILPKDEYLPYVERCYEFIGDNMADNDNKKFSSLEHSKFKRILEYMRNTDYDDDKLKRARKDFHGWITEHDRRHGKSFVDTFPDMMDFWDTCKRSN